MTKEVLACPDLDGKDTRKTKIVNQVREYEIKTKVAVGERDNPAAENGKETVYDIEIIQKSTGNIKKVLNVTYVSSDDNEYLKTLFNDAN